MYTFILNYFSYLILRWKDSSLYALQKMKELKTAITEKARQGFCTLSNYDDPKQLTSILLPLLKASIVKDFPIIEYIVNNCQSYCSN